MNTLEEITEIRQRLDALEKSLMEPQEIPPVWFKPEDGKKYAVARQNSYGEWICVNCVAHGPVTHPVLHPYHAARYVQAMNTLALLRAESDEVVDGMQYGSAPDAIIAGYASHNHKYRVCGGIFKTSKEALYALLSKHNVTPETVAKMLRFVNGDKTAGDW